MRIAVVPWSDDFLDNRLFDIEDPERNRDNRLNSFWEMRNEFLKNGDVFDTIDLYDDVGTVDYFLFFELDLRWLVFLLNKRLDARLVYCNAEPAVVNSLHCEEGYRRLKRYFPYIMTWDDSLIDNSTVFKRNIPHYFQNCLSDIPFEERKLLVNISGNKSSAHPQELYSEREKLIGFFESSYGKDFDLYGTGWDKTVHPSYKGKAGNKTELYHQYRFALALENMGHTQGYITEKIFDCLSAGVVPVYAGADNIRDYVPEACYIDYYRFQTPQELADFLKGMGREAFEQYQTNIREFLESGIASKFTGTEYARDVYDMIHRHPVKNFSVRAADRFFLKLEYNQKRFKKKIRYIMKRLIK